MLFILLYSSISLYKKNRISFTSVPSPLNTAINHTSSTCTTPYLFSRINSTAGHAIQT